VTGDIHKGVL